MTDRGDAMPAPNQGYICRIASLNDMNRKWDDEIRRHPGEKNWAVWKDEAIEGFLSGRSVPYYGFLDGTPVCEATAVIDPGLPPGSGITDEHIAELCAFRTVREVRGKGYFSMLMGFMLNDLKQKGYTKAAVGVEPGEKTNRAMYHHWGFTQYIGTGHETYPDGTVIDVKFYVRQL